LAIRYDAIVQLGFRLLGRHKQVELGRYACSRLALLSETSLRQPDGEPEFLDRLDSTPRRLVIRPHCSVAWMSFRNPGPAGVSQCC